jgi:hypothetical protein
MKISRTHWEVAGMLRHLVRFGNRYRWNVLCEKVILACCELAEYPWSGILIEKLNSSSACHGGKESRLL